MSGSGVQVLVRVRPPNKQEASASSITAGPLKPTPGTLSSHNQVVKIHRDGKECQFAEAGFPASSAQSQVSSSSSSTKRFTYDGAFDSNSTQEDVFDKVGAPMVSNVIKGFNGTILAYGQTSSGKTHTMMGPEGGNPDLMTMKNRERGLVPRVAAAIFEELNKRPSSELTWTVEISVFELYNEELHDLVFLSGNTATPAMTAAVGSAVNLRDAAAASQNGLSSSMANNNDLPSPPELRIREDRASGRGIFVEGLTKKSVRDPESLLSVIRAAASSKHMGATLANETSSRSHTLVQINVTQVDHVEEDAKTSAQLYLVDLAGSERITKTGAAGDRLKEAQNINLSLTLLGNVINKLTDGKSLHVPYRDSKLTRLLQDSLGGNAMTTLLCACSPSSLHASETLSTLQFASRAKSIQNKPIANKELSEGELRKAFAAAQEQIRALKEKVQLYEGGGERPVAAAKPTTPIDTSLEGPSSTTNTGTPNSSSSHEIEDMKATIRSLLRELAQEKEEKSLVQEDLAKAKDRIAFHEKKEADLSQAIEEWKAKYNREKMACESWMRKVQEMLPGGVVSSTSSKTATSQAKAKPPPKPKRSNSTVSARRASKTTTTLSVPTPPPEESPLNNEKEKDTAEEREVKALMRERMLLSQVEELSARVKELGRFSIMADKSLREIEQMKSDHVKALDQQQTKYEDLLKRQDDEIMQLQLKLDTRAGEKVKLNSQVLELEEEKKKLDDKIKDLERISGAPAHGGGRQRGALYDDAHLKQENEALHSENRVNAMRLLDFTKKVESLTKEVAELKDQRDDLFRRIEATEMSAELKEKLLGRKMKDMRSNFRQKLLDCFSRDDE